ncbi:MAG: hypothetical protein R2877_00090 [Bdellovibrionota bacterium]
MSRFAVLFMLALGYSTDLLAANIYLIKKDKIVEKMDSIRFDLCSKGRLAYSSVDHPKDSKSVCDEKKYVDEKYPITNVKGDELSTVKAGEIEIKSPSSDFTDVLHNRIEYMMSEQPAFEKRLIGISIENREIVEGEDKIKQVIIYLFKEGSLIPEQRIFNE